MPEMVKVPVVVEWWDDRGEPASREEIPAKIAYQEEAVWVYGLGSPGVSLAIPLKAIAEAIAAGVPA